MPEELDKRIKISLRSLVSLIGGTAIAVFTLTMIYAQFLHHGNELVRVEGRVEKKTSRNLEDIEANEASIDELKEKIIRLEQTGTDIK